MAGSQGKTGATGKQGPPGPRGKQGPAGQRGKSGPAGPRGETGKSGPAGPRGSAGPRGPAGPRGERGARGAVGERGRAGAAGPRGDRGEPGPVGDRGTAGPAGPQGSPGSAFVKAPLVVGAGHFYDDGRPVAPSYNSTAVTRNRDGFLVTFAGYQRPSKKLYYTVSFMPVGLSYPASIVFQRNGIKVQAKMATVQDSEFVIEIRAYPSTVGVLRQLAEDLPTV